MRLVRSNPDIHCVDRRRSVVFALRPFVQAPHCQLGDGENADISLTACECPLASTNHLDRELTILTMVFSTQNSVQIRKHDANQAEAICRLLEIVQFWDLTQPYKEIWCSNFSTAWVLADHVRVRA